MDKNKRYSPEEITAIFRSVFNTPEGGHALHILSRRFDAPSLIPTQVGDGNAMVPLTFARIGEQNVVRFIRKCMEKPDDGRDTE